MKAYRVAMIVAFWVVYLAVAGPFLISHDSYELPIAGGLIALFGAWVTYQFLKKETK